MQTKALSEISKKKEKELNFRIPTPFHLKTRHAITPKVQTLPLPQLDYYDHPIDFVYITYKHETKPKIKRRKSE